MLKHHRVLMLIKLYIILLSDKSNDKMQFNCSTINISSLMLQFNAEQAQDSGYCSQSAMSNKLGTRQCCIH